MKPETVERRAQLLALLETEARTSDPWMTTSELLEATGLHHSQAYPNLLAMARRGHLIHWPAYQSCPVEGDFMSALRHGRDNNARWRHQLVFDPAPIHDMELLEQWLAS
jgi:hypothetical protein